MSKPFQFEELVDGGGSQRPGPPARASAVKPAKAAAVAFPGLALDEIGAGEQRASPPVARCRHSDEDLAAAIREARRTTAIEVESEIRAALAADIGKRQIEAFEAIRDRLSSDIRAMEGWRSDVARASQRLAVCLAEAVVPRALERVPLADIADMLRATTTHLVDQPSIQLRLPPDLVEPGATLLGRLLDEIGYKGKLDAVGDASLEAGDATLCWQGGAAVRSLDRLQADVAALLDAWLPSAPPCPADRASPSAWRGDASPPATAVPSPTDHHSPHEQAEP